MTDERLSQLLKFKALEKPSEISWARFEAHLERRCLRAPLQVSIMERYRSCFHKIIVWAKQFLPLSTASLALALMFFKLTQKYNFFQQNIALASASACSFKEFTQNIIAIPNARELLAADIIDHKAHSLRYVQGDIARKTFINQPQTFVSMCF